MELFFTFGLNSQQKLKYALKVFYNNQNLTQFWRICASQKRCHKNDVTWKL